jgi:hypothetical protein
MTVAEAIVLKKFIEDKLRSASQQLEDTVSSIDNDVINNICTSNEGCNAISDANKQYDKETGILKNKLDTVNKVIEEYMDNEYK